MKTLIKEFETKNEGVILRLTSPTSLQSGNIISDEFYVSWDKIGALLFDDYATGLDVDELRKLRAESPQYATQRTAEVGDIRNKLTPITNLIAMIENGLVHGTVAAHDLILSEIEQCKKSIKYLTALPEPPKNSEERGGQS